MLELANEKDILMELYKTEREQCRDHEIQRSALANIFVLVSGVLVGLATYDQKVNVVDLPAIMLLVVLGAFGAAFSQKQYERHQFHSRRAREYRNHLDKLFPAAKLVSLKEKAEHEQKQKYPILWRVRLNWLWTSLYAFIALTGALLAVLAAVSAGGASPIGSDGA